MKTIIVTTGKKPAKVSPVVELTLQQAVDRACEFYKAGKPGRGEYELVRGGLRAAQMTGDMVSVNLLIDLKYYEISVPMPARARDQRLEEIGGTLGGVA